MKKLNQWMLAAILICGTMTVTSCQGLVDAIFGETDTPSGNTTKPSSDEKTDDKFDAKTTPLTLEALAANTVVKIKLMEGLVPSSVEYSNDGTTWTALSKATQEFTLAKAGDKLMLRGENAAYASSTDYTNISCSVSAASTRAGTRVPNPVEAAKSYGNIMSLIKKDFGTEVKLTKDYTFKNLFKDGGINIDADKELLLPATSLKASCYQGMFAGNEALKVAPTLPAPKLVESCYEGMFEGCSSLSSVTMLAIEEEAGANNCLKNWLKDAGSNSEDGLTLTVNEETNIATEELAGGNEDVTIVEESGDIVPTGIQIKKNGEVLKDGTELEMEVGEEIELTAVLLPEGAKGEIEWGAYDDILSIDNGKVKALKAGTSPIAVVCKVGENKLTAEIKVTVKEAASNETYRVYSAKDTYTDKAIPTEGVTTWTGTVTAGDVAAGTYVVDGTATCNGNLTLKGNIDLILKDGASLTVSGYINGGQSINIYGQKESTGKLSASGSGIAILAKNLTVHGGNITVPDAGIEQGIETGGVLTVYNGTINTTGIYNGIMNLGGMYVYGGEVTANATNGAAISLYKEESSDECDLTISGGTVTAKSTSGPGIDAMDTKKVYGKVIISGGTVVATSGGYGISSTTSITISGGSATATSTGEDGIGITAPTITFSGSSTVIEASGSMEGILADGGNLTIQGGDITATAGTTSGNSGGNGMEGLITISGGDVKATGGNAKSSSDASGGVGIDGTLTVNGGKLTATGGAKDGTGDDGLGISGGTTIKLGSGIKLYEGDSANPTSEAASQTECTKRYAIVK